MAGNLRVRNRVAHAQTCQALRLGEGAQDDDVRVVTIDVQAVQRGLFPLRDGGGRTELEVGFVDDHGNGSRHLREEGANLALGDGGAGRVIGGAHEDQAGTVGDGRGHSVQVVRTVGQVGNLHAAGAHDANQNGVGLEGTPRVDDFILHAVGVNAREGFEDLVERTEAAGAGHDVLGVHAQLPGESGAQGG